MKMKRDKIIRRIGDSVGIIFNKEERLLFKLAVDDEVEVALKKKQGDSE